MGKLDLQFFGGRGAVSTIGKAAFDAPLDISKTGAIFKSLPTAFQENIVNNLKLSEQMKRDIENGRRNKISDEWVTGLAYSKTKMKVITDVKGKTIQYTAKIGNKVITRTNSKTAIANTVAKFYKDEREKK